MLLDTVIKNRKVKVAVVAVVFALLTPFNIFSESLAHEACAADTAATFTAEQPDSVAIVRQAAVVADGIVHSDTLLSEVVDEAVIADSVSLALLKETQPVEELPMKVFNPDPTRAVWLSALFPGLGQLYNRRYWKLPLVVGGFMALGYGTSWNNGMLRDYTKAYNDLLDNDPTTKSYMDFFPPTTQESDLDPSWLSRLLKSRKDFYRRNRDLCIISMVGVYILAMVDAYVDASLAHFDISPDLSFQVQPAVIPDSRSKIPGFGLQWALNF